MNKLHSQQHYLIQIGSKAIIPQGPHTTRRPIVGDLGEQPDYTICKVATTCVFVVCRFVFFSDLN